MKIVPDQFGLKPSSNNANTPRSTSNKRLAVDLIVDKSPINGAQIAISERIIAQARGMDQAMRNAQDAASMAQTADGALAEVNSVLQEMRQLAVQSSNGTYTTEDRAVIDNQFQQLKSYVDDIGKTTQYNTKNLFGTAGSYQLGGNEGAQIVSIVGQMGAESLGLTNLSIAGISSSQYSVSALDSATDLVTSQRNSLGTMQNGIEHQMSSLATGFENLNAANSSLNQENFAQTLLDTIKAFSTLSPENVQEAHSNLDPLRVMSLISD